MKTRASAMPSDPFVGSDEESESSEAAAYAAARAASITQDDDVEERGEKRSAVHFDEEGASESKSNSDDDADDAEEAIDEMGEWTEDTADVEAGPNITNVLPHLTKQARTELLGVLARMKTQGANVPAAAATVASPKAKKKKKRPTANPTVTGEPALAPADLAAEVQPTAGTDNAIPTLLRRMQELAAEAEDDEDVVAELKVQGEGDNNLVVKEFLVNQVDPVGVLFFQPNHRQPHFIHSLGMFTGGPRRKDTYDGHMLGAIGKRETVTDIQWFSVPPRMLRWAHKDVINIAADGSDEMSTFFSIRDNRMKFFNMATAAEASKTAVEIPRIVMVPSAVAPMFLQEDKTAFELFIELRAWTEARDQAVIVLITPILHWLLWSCTKGANENTSDAAADVHPVTMPSQKLKQWQKLRVSGTLGEWSLATVVQHQQSAQAHGGAGAAAAAAMSASEAEAMFMKGASTVMRLHGDVMGSGAKSTRKYTEMQWASLIGFCGVSKRSQLPIIWKALEKAKDGTEARVIILAAVKAQQTNIDAQSNRVWFGEDTADDIRAAKFAHSPVANAARTEKGLSVMLFIRRTAKQISEYEEEELAWKATKTPTIEELKKRLKAERLPPTNLDTANKVLTTYSLVLKILFGNKSAHKFGLDEIRAALLNLSEMEEDVGADYLAHIFWAILDDSCQFFSSPMMPDDIRSLNINPASVRRPATMLFKVAERITCRVPLGHLSMPLHWLGRGGTAKLGYQSFGASMQGQYQLPGQWQTPPSYPPPPQYAPSGYSLPPMPSYPVIDMTGDGGTGGGAGGGQRNAGEPKERFAEAFRAKFPARYRGGSNNNMHPTIRRMMTPYLRLGPMRLLALCRSGKVPIYKLANAHGFTGTKGTCRTCTAYSCGECKNEQCKLAHLTPTEMNPEYPKELVKQLGAAIADAVTKSESSGKKPNE